MEFNNKCVGCKRNIHCCIFKNNSGFTFVGIQDAKRIKRETKKEYSEFLTYSPLPKKIISSLKNDDPSLEGSLRYSQLKKDKILRIKTTKEGRCVFLDDKNKCTIYNIRPKICRIYPYWGIRLINNKIKIIEHDDNTRCQVVLSLTNTKNNSNNAKKNADIENFLLKDEIKKLKTIFLNIEKENKYYKKNINKFVKENKLN